MKVNDSSPRSGVAGTSRNSIADPRITRWLVAALLLAAPPLAMAEPDFNSVGIAGTFNNWNSTTEAYHLSPVDDQHYELVRFWPCGEREFKFVFNNSWDRHLGWDGQGGLTQPGENLKLSITQSGVYAICLDLSAKRFEVQRRAADKPYAIFVVRQPYDDTIMLDASASVAREDAPIKKYTWSAEPAGLEGLPTANVPKVRINRDAIKDFAGTICLTIDDGEQQAETSLEVDFRAAPRLNITKPDGRKETRVMLPIGDATWGCALAPSSTGEYELAIQGASLSSNADLRAKWSYLAKYDAAAKTLRLLDANWHQFTYTPAADKDIPDDLIIERVEVVGDFTGWQTGKYPMITAGDENTYHAIVEIPDGVYHYKFLVNGSMWMDDPHADPRFTEDDNRGSRNSGVLIGMDGTTLGAAKPEHINRDALKHDPDSARYFTAIADNLLLLTVRTLADDVDRVEVVLPRDDRHVPMRRVESKYGFDYWSAQILVDGGKPRYAFAVVDGKQLIMLGGQGAVTTDDKLGSFFEPDIDMEFETPDWAKRVVWYQIFPERFRNGTPDNDPPRTVPWTHAWYEPYKGDDFQEKGTFFQFIFDRRYGGDIQGIQEKLPYLRDLGVTAIYLNPVFIAESLHKYDATDYRHIDDFFGVKDSLKKIEGETLDPTTWQWSETDKLFLAFLKEAHRQGFKVIIDGVFNHTGREFWAFQDVLKHGKDSRYAGWFEIKSWEPLQWRGWDGDNGFLPVLKHDDELGLAQEVRDHLFAVTRRWMDPNGDGDPSDGIDGWRLDVASDINANFWAPWRQLVKSINPDAYIVAELWEESRAWLDGKTFDAVMNYPVARAAQRFFVNQRKASKPSVFDEQLREVLGWYVPQVNYVQQNLYNSHDTDRVASMFMNPDLEYDKSNRQQDNGPDYNVERPTPECYERLKPMVMFQMTFVGAPMFYYGDEVGMYGADDPSCRKPMYWEDLMPYDDPDESIIPGLRDFYRRMITIRNEHPALQLGSFETLLMHDRNKLYSYCRTLGDESIVIFINNDKKPHKLDVPSPWPDGSKIVRLDDPEACEVVAADPNDPAGRPTLKIVEGHKSKLKVDGGKLKGLTIPGKTGAIFKCVD